MIIKETKIKTEDDCDEKGCSGIMELAHPVIKHPQLDGYYRSRCPKCKWLGWTEHEIPVTPVSAELIAEQEDRAAFQNALRAYNKVKQYVDMGILTEEEAGLEDKKADAKLKYKDGY